MDRAVARGLRRKPHVVPAKVGVDEKAAGRGQGYITVVPNLETCCVEHLANETCCVEHLANETRCVEHLADERRQASLDGFFEKFDAEERKGTEAVAMDMWHPYVSSARDHLDNADAKIVFERYHLMKYMTGALGTVRKHEDRALAAGGDKSLSGAKYLWLCLEGNLPERHQDRFASLRGGDLKTARVRGSRRAFATSGPTSAGAGGTSAGSAGTSGQPTEIPEAP